MIRKKIKVLQNELPLLSKPFTDNFMNFTCDLIGLSYVPTTVNPIPTDNIIATTVQVEQVADQTTNTIMGGLTVVGAAIAGGVR